MFSPAGLPSRADRGPRHPPPERPVQEADTVVAVQAWRGRSVEASYVSTGHIIVRSLVYSTVVRPDYVLQFHSPYFPDAETGDVDMSWRESFSPRRAQTSRRFNHQAEGFRGNAALAVLLHDSRTIHAPFTHDSRTIHARFTHDSRTIHARFTHDSDKLMSGKNFQSAFDTTGSIHSV